MKAFNPFAMIFSLPRRRNALIFKWGVEGVPVGIPCACLAQDRPPRGAPPEFHQDTPLDRRMFFLVKANRILVPATAILGVASLCYFWFYPGRQASGVEKNIKMVSESSKGLEAAGVSPGMPASQIKNLFEPVSSAEKTVSADAVSKFKVVGIILDGNPQAVLLDRQENRSVFVHKGDHLAGFVVKDIQEGKVILSFKDHEWELMP